MDGFERRKELKKLNILEASLELFMAYGIQKVSIAEIAKKANVSQVTIYNYFDSKDNLVYQTIVYYIDKAWEEALEIMDSGLSFHEKLEQLIFRKSETAGSIHENFYLHLMQEYSSGIKYMEDLYQQQMIPKIIEFFNEGRVKGMIDPDLSDEAILFYFQMIKEYAQREDVYSKVLPLTEDISNILFYGIAGKKKKD